MDLTNITIMNRRVLVRPIKKEKDSDIIVLNKNDTDEFIDNKGEIVKVGLGTQIQNGTFIPLNVQVGDIIIFSKYSKNFIEIDKEKFILLTEEEIYAILNRHIEPKYV